MPSTSWQSPVNGAFNDPARWTMGAPNAGLDARITVNGGYTVTVGGVSTTGDLLLNAAGATLFVANAGTLTGTDLTLRGGDLVARGVIGFERTFLDGDASLGLRLPMLQADSDPTPIFMSAGAIWALDDLTLESPLSMSGVVTFGAVADKTHTIRPDAPWGFNLALGISQIRFGDADHPGDVVWESMAGSGATGIGVLGVHVDYGRLIFTKSDDELALEADVFEIANTAEVVIGIQDLTFNSLFGQGRVFGKAGAELDIGGGEFDGELDGQMLVNVTGDFTYTGIATFDGGLNILGNLTIDSGAALGKGPVTIDGGSLRTSADAAAVLGALVGLDPTIDPNGHTLKVKGGLSTVLGTHIHLGSAAGGVLQVNSTSFTGPFGGFDLTIHGGYVRGGVGIQNFGLLDMLTRADSITNLGVLDLTGLGSVALSELLGDGTLLGKGAATQVFGSAWDFHGAINGNLQISLGGDNDLTGIKFKFGSNGLLVVGTGEVDINLAGAKYRNPIDIDLDSGATTTVTISNNFDGVLIDMGPGDTVRLPFIDFDTVVVTYLPNIDPETGGVLVLEDEAGHVAEVPLAGADYDGSFDFNPDGSGGVLVTTTTDPDAPPLGDGFVV